jgi:hypothetical protein
MTTRRLPTLAVLVGAAMAALIMLMVVGTAPEKADAQAVAAGGSSSASVPELAWQPCSDPAQSGFECASARVPLDYTDPQGSTIELAVIRHLASEPTNRIGALFFNPGGPGGIGTKDLPAFFEFFPDDVRERFDIISWDPRGVGDSTAVQCFDTKEAEQSFFAGIPFGFFPVGAAQQRAWIRAYARFGQLCEQRNGDLLAHIPQHVSKAPNGQGRGQDPQRLPHPLRSGLNRPVRLLCRQRCGHAGEVGNLVGPAAPTAGEYRRTDDHLRCASVRHERMAHHRGARRPTGYGLHRLDVRRGGDTRALAS